MITDPVSYVTEERFREFLLNGDLPESVIGLAGSPTMCPLALWLNLVFHQPVEIGMTNFSLLNEIGESGRRVYHSLPMWARKFVRLCDHYAPTGIPQITRLRAMEILAME